MMDNPLAALARLFVPQPPEDERFRTSSLEEFPSMEQQIAAIRHQFATPRPYRAAGISEALGVPAILSAVSLIANTIGTLSLEAYRNGSLLEGMDVPRLVVRPNPYSTPRDFFRDLAFYLATRGEAWAWVAARDADGMALSLYPVPPWQIRVEPNERNVLFPRIFWNDRQIRNEDMRHITYLPSADGLRGVGPLQLAGAAVSVTVEADAWAANFFSGSLPSIIGRTDMDLDENDTKALDAQWLEKPSNMPRWLGGGIELEEPPYNAEKAQLADTRQFQVGEVARMFDIPGSLLEYSASGSSLTYRNEEGIWADFQRRCLNPHYLEPIEQEMSDLLTRSTVAKFNTQQLLRSDIKTRFEVYKLAVDVFGQQQAAELAARNEGLVPGAVDYAPIGPATPQATPNILPFQRTAQTGTCPSCRKHLADVAPPGWQTRCPRCGTLALA